MIETPDQSLVQLPKHLFDYFTAKPLIDAMISSFSLDITEAKMRRDERYVNLDVEELRQSGDIEEDETFIPDRVINSNISDDKSDTLTFLNAGTRLCIFKCTSDPTIDTRELELQITEGLTYNGWYKEFDRTVDGAALHGRDYIEVTFDVTKPLHVGFEHVGFDRLYFNRKLESVEDSEEILREYSLAVYKLEEFRDKFRFDPEQVAKVLTSFQDKERQKAIKLFKRMFKYDGCIYVCWYCQEKGPTDWLKPPEKLHLGIWEQDQTIDPMTNQPTNELIQSHIYEYPIKPYVYREDEQQFIVEKKGRGFLDSPLQEANTAIITSYVNQSLKASRIFASPKTDDGESAEMKQLDVRLENGGIYAKPLEFWSMPAPGVQQLSSIQFLDTRNATQRGKTAYAVSNRKDSRKTKEELVQSEKNEQQIVAATNLATFSEFSRSVFQFAWKIIQSQALTGKIKLLLVESPTGFVNNLPVLQQEFDVRPAGDTDVVEAQQEQQKMQQDWPVIQTTPLAGKFMEDYINLRYPKKAQEYAQILRQGIQDKGKQLVNGLSAALQGALSEEDLKSMDAQGKQNLQTLQQEVQSYLGQPSVI